MATQFPIQCDICGNLMLLRQTITRHQSYECPRCADRWAIVWVNTSGGINTVRHTNGADASGSHKAHTIGALLASFFSKRK